MKRQILIVPIIGLLFLTSIISTTVNGELIENRIFSLSLEYDKGDVNLIDMTLKYGFAPDRKVQPESGYTAEVISLENVKLHSFKFNIPNRLFQAPPLEGQPAGNPILLDRVNFTLIAPYFTDAGRVDIYNPNNKLLLFVDVSQYAKRVEQSFSLDSIYIIIGVIALVAGVGIFFKMKNRHSKTKKYKERR